MSEELCQEWNDLSQEYQKLEENNVLYVKKLQELTILQHECSKAIAHQRFRMKSIEQSMRNFPDDSRGEMEKLKQNVMKRQAELEKFEQMLPKQTGFYLRLVLGNINVSFLDREERFRYKDDYEKFKLLIHVVAFVSVYLLFQFPYRPLELVYISFLTWYYCTITIRESILIVNGSRIKGWWRVHHIISTVVSMILLVWPDNEAWRQFRIQFLWYNI